MRRSTRKSSVRAAPRHRASLTGRHAVADRARQLGVSLTPTQLARVTTAFKNRAARQRLGLDNLDAAIRAASKPMAFAVAR